MIGGVTEAVIHEIKKNKKSLEQEEDIITRLKSFSSTPSFKQY